MMLVKHARRRSGSRNVAAGEDPGLKSIRGFVAAREPARSHRTAHGYAAHSKDQEARSQQPPRDHTVTPVIGLPALWKLGPPALPSQTEHQGRQQQPQLQSDFHRHVMAGLSPIQRNVRKQIEKACNPTDHQSIINPTSVRTGLYTGYIKYGRFLEHR